MDTGSLIGILLGLITWAIIIAVIAHHFHQQKDQAQLATRLSEQISAPATTPAVAKESSTMSTNQPVQQPGHQPPQTVAPPGITALGDRLDGAGLVTVSDTDRQSGTYLLGVQGTGKSSLMEQIIFQDIAKGYSVIVLDPHSDLIDHVITELPEQRLAKTYLLDIEDTAYPFGLNLFSLPPEATVTEQQQALDRVLHVFEKCFPDTSKMLLEKYLGNIAPVFFVNQHAGYGMTDIPNFLRDDLLRTRLIKNARLFIRQFWQDDYGQLSPSKRQGETASLSTRLNRFMRSPIAGNIIGQKSTTIDFRKAIENKEILLIRLPVKTLQEDATLIGTMLVAEIYAAIFSFADTPKEQRPGFSLFVDEFQHFATSDFSDMFTEGRKFGSRVTVAHQFRKQLPPYLEESTLTARTIISFAATHEDAGRLAKLFTDPAKTVSIENIPLDPIKYLLNHGHKNATVSQFVTDYLMRLDSFMHGQSRNRAFAMGNVSCQVSDAEDAKQKLNKVLYQCMRENRTDLYIPPIVLLMLGGAHDYDIACAIDAKSDFMATYVYQWHFKDSAKVLGHPAWLQDRGSVQNFINRKGQGGYKLVQMLILIRQVMEILAKEPIGDASGDSSGETAQKIIGLPRRTAYVKVGQHLTTMKTRKTPEQQGSLSARKQRIRRQTHAAYCRPASEVEREIETRLGIAEAVPTTKEQQAAPLPTGQQITPQPEPVQPPPETKRATLFDED